MRRTRLSASLLLVALLLCLGLSARLARAAVGASTTLISVGLNGAPAVAHASLQYGSPSMSSDGRYVVFISNALNIASGANGQYQVFLHDSVADTTELISQSTGGLSGDGTCYEAVMTPDGRYVLFSSYADNLVANDTNGYMDVFLRDRTAGTTTRVSVTPAGLEGVYGASDDLAITPDGRYVVFASQSPNFTAVNFNGVQQIFVKDRANNTLELVSVSSAGVPSDVPQWGYGASISSDGRYVAFSSDGDNLVASDSNGSMDVFVRDRSAQVTALVSAGLNGSVGNGDSRGASISANGRYVLFESSSTNLTASSPGFGSQVYVRDLMAGSTQLVSVATDGSLANSWCQLPAMSSDARYVAFVSGATNLAAGDTNGKRDVFLRDRTAGTTVRVSLADGGAQENGDAEELNYGPAVSSDGRYVVFASAATNLVAGDTNGKTDLFLRDLTGGTTKRMNVGPGGLQGVGGAVTNAGRISADGRYVIFSSDAINLVAGDTNDQTDVFVLDRTLGVTERVSVSSAGEEGNGASGGGWLSADGRFAVFTSSASNLVAGDTNGNSDVFVRDRLLGSTERISVSGSGAQAQGDSFGGIITPDGRYVTFVSQSSGLVSQNHFQADVYLRDRVLGTTERVSVATDGSLGNGASSGGSMSADGRYVGFNSDATNFVANDTNGWGDAFVRDRKTGTTTCVSVSSAGVLSAGLTQGCTLSADGHLAAFNCYGRNLVTPAPPSGYANAYVHDLNTGTTEICSLSADGSGAYYGGYNADISGDGRYVTFSSYDALVPDDNNFSDDIFLRDRQQHTTSRVSVAGNGGEADGRAYYGSISTEGRFVLFSDDAGNLVPGDTNGSTDLFLRDRGSAGQVPAAPSGLTAVFQTGGRAQLTWTDNSNNETLFRIERSTDGGATFTEIGSTGLNTPSFLDAGLTAGTYVYRVRAANADGTSAASGTASITVSAGSIGAPTNLRATPLSASSVQLDWKDNSSNETSFIIERSTGGAFAQVGTAAANATTYTDTGLDSNATYSYRMHATGATGDSGNSNTSNALTLPLPPMGVKVTVLGDTAIGFTWTDANKQPAAVLFDVTSSNGSGSSGLIAAGETSDQETGLVPGTTYKVRLAAINDSGTSAYTSPISVTTTGGKPDAPGQLSVTNATATTLQLQWVAGGTSQKGFDIERRTPNGNYSQIGTTGANVTSYSDSGLASNTAYTYRVRAFNDSGESDYSPAKDALTLPAPPQNVSATVLSSNEIRLQWTDPNLPAADAYIEVAQGSGPYVQIASVGAGITNRNVDTEPATTYHFRLRCKNDTGYSDYSSVVDATTPGLPPGDITSFSATVISDAQVNLIWSPSQRVETYYIEREVGTGNWLPLVQLGATSYSDLTVTGGTTYTYRIHAGNSAGSSSYAVTSAVTTPAAPVGKLSYPKSVNFGKIGVGSTRDLVVTLKNASKTQRLRVKRGAITGPYQVVADLSPTTLDPGASATIKLRFTASSKGSLPGSLALTSSDPKAASVTIQLSGSGK